MSGWTQWTEISRKEEFKKLYQACGVYKIRALDSAGCPIEIGRFHDTDKDGILLIGNSKRVGERIRDFYKAYEQYRFSRHNVGERLFLLKYLLRNVTSFKERVCAIEFSVEQLKSKNEAVAEEERLLKCYVLKYAELPPLNRNLPDNHYTQWNNLNCKEGLW